ncbi:MAG: hypothetical protein FJ102_27170 [Deltaproteobacteria bacterium]|nr:hypothetical protein [Deltaproteobacteria bacterium]
MAIAVFAAGAPASGNGLVTEDQLNDLVLAERAFQLALVDTADFFDTPAIVVSDGTGGGSLVQRHRILTMGWGLSMDATAAEDTDVSASSVTAADTDVTIARRALRIDETGLARSVGSAWGFDPIALGLTMVDSFRAGRMGALGTALAGASTNVTSTGTGSIDDLYDVIDSFTASVGDPGQLFGMLHPVTLSSIRDSLRSEVGPQKERPDIQAFLAKGAEMLLGILCMPSTKITTAAGKYENAIMAPGAIAYGIAQPQRMLGGNVVVAAPTDMPLLIELERDASRDVWQIVANGYDGLAIREQARVRGLLASTS